MWIDTKGVVFVCELIYSVQEQIQWLVYSSQFKSFKVTQRVVIFLHFFRVFPISTLSKIIYIYMEIEEKLLICFGYLMCNAI